MELISLVLSVVLSIGIAVWEHRRAEVATRAQRELLGRIPGMVADQMGQVLAAGPPRQESAPLSMGDPDARVRRLFPYDVTGDGQSELLVEYDMGMHSSGLKVFAWRDCELQSIGELWSDSETSFEVGDFDGDGRNEVRAYQSDPAMFELPYGLRPWVRVTYRWDDGEFRMVRFDRDLHPHDPAAEPAAMS